ncbi:mitochondrial glutathione transporter SLC25A40-like [Centruroides vittatus]|uniref:mitochondrial glutathione transporter SLC25A40-like n=1 Tax=Centruroides vittatus TaxID=120091 RepID=UPI00350ED563
MTPTKTTITPLQQMMSSCTGAIITSIFVTPLDVVKIRLQTQQKEFMKNKCYIYCDRIIEDICCIGQPVQNSSVGYIGQQSNRLRSHHFTGTADAFIKIARSEGIPSLWSGLPPTLIMAVPATVVYFTVYDQLQERISKNINATQKPLWIPMFSGAAARVFAASFVSPIELVRTKMQSKRLSYIEIGQAIRSLVQYQGLSSLWRGLAPTLMRDVPFSSIYWASYETLKQKFQQEQPTFWFSFAAGASSGAIAAVLTLPFDVIKTHRQIELGELETQQAKSELTKSSTYQRLVNLYQKRGFRALFTGIVPRVVKVAPACAIMISTYEFGKHFFRQFNSSKTNNDF